VLIEVAVDGGMFIGPWQIAQYAALLDALERVDSE